MCSSWPKTSRVPTYLLVPSTRIYDPEAKHIRNPGVAGHTFFKKNIKYLCPLHPALLLFTSESQGSA